MDISGIFPVLPTPFDADGTPDEAALRRLVRYALASGVDGVTYPGVASEVSELAPDERVRLVAAVQDELAGRRPLIVGISGSSVEMCIALGRSALERDVAAFMVAAPADRKDVAQQIGFFSALGAALRVPIMLQNVPPPAGAGLAPDTVVAILQAVPAIAYVKEETLPSGQRLTSAARARSRDAARCLRRRRRTLRHRRAAPRRRGIDARDRARRGARGTDGRASRRRREPAFAGCSRACCRCSTCRRCSAGR